MKIPHDKFCVLPWVSLETSPIGTVRPCCLAEHEIVDSAGVKFNLATANLTAVQSSEYMQALRQDFLDGKRPATCRKCWAEEDAGRTSKRMHTLERLRHMIPDRAWEPNAKPLMFLDLKLGNICNLKCRICGSWSSSQFAVEEIRFSSPGQADFHRQMLRQGAWPRENPVFWDQIDGMLDQIRYIEFTGGEPFMIQEHFDMLTRMVDRGIAPQVEIHYNTNGTHYPEHAEKIWQNFKTVEIAFSIDDVDKRFEYQRTNAVWTDVLKNLTKFKQLRSRSSNIQLQCCITVNVFNIRYLRYVADWTDCQGFDFVYWNMLHDAPHWSISNLPLFAKQQLTAYLDNCNPPEKFRDEFSRIRDFMNTGIGSDGTELCDKIADLDHRRNQNFKKVCPEMASILRMI